MYELLMDTSLMPTLVVSVIKASLILGVAQLIVLSVHTLPAAAKHLLLTLGMSAFLLVPLLSAYGPAWSVAIVPAPGSAGTPANPELIQEAEATVRVAPLSSSTKVLPAPSGVSIASPVRFETMAAVLWSLVTLLLLIRMARSTIRLRTILNAADQPSARLTGLLNGVLGRLSVRSPVLLLRSRQVRVPMVWGVRHGTLLVPELAEGWTDEELRATFIHEVGHLQRMDYVSLALLNLVSALLWFHPQVWFARRRALAEGERACDDLVLRTGERASEYASHLLHVARQHPRRELTAILAMSRPSQLEARMVAILSSSINRQAIGGKLIMISLTAFIALVVPFSMAQISAEPVVVQRPLSVSSNVAAPVVVNAPASTTNASRDTVTTRTEPDVIESVAPVLASGRVENSFAEVPIDAPAADPVVLPVIDDSTPIEPDAVESGETPAAVAEAPESPTEAVGDPAASSSSIPVLTSSELDSRAHEVISKMEGRACTVKLNRPRNTGDPTRNPAEALAIERLLKSAAGKGADAVANLRCYAEIRIGLACPTAVVCQGEAIRFESNE